MAARLKGIIANQAEDYNAAAENSAGVRRSLQYVTSVCIIF
jgi:hypothetical protein